MLNLESVLAELREERDRLDAAISDLERLEHIRRRCAGRPRGLATRNPTNGMIHGAPPDPAPGES